ncbi:MAG: hypothetical protein ABI927_04245, partial [Gaiellaceae bacterium]
MVRRKHDAEGRRDNVELVVGIRHRLHIADIEVDVQSALVGLATRGGHERVRKVHARDVGTGRCGEERQLARATRCVEPLIPRFRVKAVDDRFVNVRDRRRNFLERAAAPRGALTLLQLLEGHA